ncbi:unnamed protein product [marine sediment metagenome]|uniref:Uncharacterized protein n=1 Tax=marine sediment metagenome TaxID=412755 RepID=X0YEL9_9ZZZZ
MSNQKITKQKVEKIAALARIELKPKEVDKFSNQLTDILDYVNQLNKVDTKDVELTAQVTKLINVMRADKVKSCKNPDKLIKAAPESQDGQVKVKSIL